MFIVVCNNRSTSKLVYDFISGFKRKNEDETETYVGGRFELFRNYDGYGERFARPRTLLIDSEQLESGEALDKEFRNIGDGRAGEKITDQDLLREVMNTVGKPGQLGESIRYVVSVSMLTEGWDANTVTHILGVRAFGTQLLCERLRIASGVEEALITGDFMHHPCQIARPDWSSSADSDPAAARQTRERILTGLADTSILVIGTHFAGRTAGHIVPDGDAFRLAV